jgi:hypothetical protein
MGQSPSTVPINSNDVAQAKSLYFPTLQFIFFKVRCTVSWEISTTKFPLQLNIFSVLESGGEDSSEHNFQEAHHNDRAMVWAMVWASN